jgi:hypothetical protein
VPTQDRVLDKEKLKRLRVTWEKPRRKVDKEALDPVYLEITGKLSLLKKDGKSLEPVDWPYPISVVLARRPGEKPDWSRWHDRRDSLWFDTFVGRDLVSGSQGGKPLPLPRRPVGVFTAKLPLDEIHSAVGATKPFQVGLCFGEKKGKKITWCNVAPILPQSVKMLDVPGPRPLSRTLQLINACPTLIGWSFDPISLVRATNHLRSLGKDKAIAALREFLDLAHDAGYTRRRIDPENIDTSNQWCLASLVPLVFPGVDKDGEIRVWQGIPFHTIVISGTSGSPGSTRPLVDEAAREGVLRKKPLRPADNPLEAADSLFEKIARPKDREQSRFELREHLRGQAWRAVRHLVDPFRKQPPNLSSQAVWDNLKAKAARLKVRWDPQRQEYVAGEKDK